MRRNSEGGKTLPEGFDGEFKMSILVRGVIACSTCLMVKRKPVSSVSMKTGFPPANTTISGNVTQYGLGSRTSSSGFTSVTTALKIACLPPDVPITSDG